MSPATDSGTDLRAAIRAALEGRSGFQATDGDAAFSAVPVQDWAAYARQFLFWKMSNSLIAVRHLLEAIDAGVVPILVPPRIPAHKLSTLRLDHPGFGYFDGEEIEPVPAPVHVHANAILCVLTSGSTGKPKLVAASDAGLTAGVRAIHASQHLDGVASTGVVLPLAYSFALVNQLLWAVLFERRLVLLPGMVDPAGTLGMARREHVAMLCMVAAQVQTLATLGFDAEEALASVKIVNLAGSTFPLSHLGSMRELFPTARFFNNYGCTEAMPRLTVAEVVSDDHPVTLVGHAIDGVSIRIVGEEPDVGPIEFKSASASIGLLRADGTAEPHGEWIASGDLGRFDNGDLHVLGRHDQVVKLGGERVSLLEIEHALQSPDMSSIAAWAEPGDREGEAVLVAVMAGQGPPTTAELMRHLRERLPRPMWPSRMLWTNEWPLLPNGKTDRVELQRLVRSDSLPKLYPAS